jgi:site-specific recombinase XerD
MIDQDSTIKMFSNYLTQEGASEKTKKNYVADLLDFLSWFNQANQTTPDANMKKPLFLHTVTNTSIQRYIHFLEAQHKTPSTINRRLSTLRVFFRACNNSGFSTLNPTDGIHNVENSITTGGEHKHVLDTWHVHLSQKGLNRYTIQNHVNVVTEFLEWIKVNK